MQNHRARRRTLAALLTAGTLLALASGCSSDDGDSSAPAAAATTTTGPAATTPPVVTSDDAFYEPITSLPEGEPGDVIRLQKIPAGRLAPATVWRVMYHSRSVAGDDIPVTGLVIVPAEAAPKGGRDVLTYTHGTTGLADVCAPSKAPSGSEAMGLAKPFLDDGLVVAATDYEGLGTPGLHPYIVGESEGRGALDIVRAARNLPATGAGERFAIWGHSQGGHAALWAAQLAPEYAPELDLVGAAPGAPATELPLIAAALKTSPFRYYLAMAAAGLHAAYPDLDFHDVFTDEAIAKLPVMDQGCSDTIRKAYEGFTYDQLAKVDDPMSVPAWAKRITESDPGHVKMAAPLFVYQGEQDEQIPVAASKLLFDRMCGLGQVIERKTYPGQSHAGVVGVALPDIEQWISDRFAGKAAPSTCPASTDSTTTTVE